MTIAGILSGAFLFFFFGSLVFLALPTNDRDNANPDKEPEMIRCTLEWGRLAPFPETAKNFDIYTEGNSFTRTFRGSFTDAPENIQTWLRSSPGVMEGARKEENQYILKTGEGSAYGEISISPDGSKVTFRVSWS
jgi:hypothetical protein